jgi:hypothetical protein
VLPRDLRPDHFRAYPPQAAKLAVDSLPALRRLPLSFLPSLLREVIEYDYKFPAERAALEKEVAKLVSLSDSQVANLFGGFSKITLSAQLESSDWVSSPAQFVEQLSAHLWTTHQVDDFRVAATKYADDLSAAVAAESPPIPRLGITVIGEGVTSFDVPLFRKLRPYGTYFSRVKPENGLRLLLEAVGTRAKVHSVPYGHWYVDGGEPADHDSALTTISYRALAPTREALLGRIQSETKRPGMGPEALRSIMARLQPADLRMSGTGDEILQRFRLKLLTEGSGTQVFSTSFAQWTAREVLRRAQPLTLLVRFAPRQRQKPMNELLSANSNQQEMDAVGSLMDADMGAYYNWLNQQRLLGAEKSSFLVWFEGHNSALAISPSIPRQTESESEADMTKILSWLV